MKSDIQKHKSSSRIPGVKKIFLILVQFMWFTPSFTQHEQHNIPTQKKENIKQPQPAVYTCVMHPEVKSSKPDNCPKCGMKLIRQESKSIIKKSAAQEHDGMLMSKVILQKGKTIRYDLYVTDTTVNFTGKPKHAYAINGSIPAPALTFTEGDTAEIYLHNNLLSEETSLHWHGIILPNEADGVPYLTTAPVPAGTTHLYKFPIVQNGTYWYHSHSKLQEQAGMYGALIFKKREEPPMREEIKEYTIVLSDWTDEKPDEVQRRLRTANDWYAIKKGSVQSYSEATEEGHFKTKVINEWKRMKAMDVSDVFYDRFLTNGKPVNEVEKFKEGERVKLRIVNGGASTYFWLQYGGGKITVTANDGNDVEPVEVDRMIIAVAETYDVMVTIPENMSYEFKATAEDRTKSTSLWLGHGMKMPAPALPRLKYFEGMKMMNGMMKMNGDMNGMGMEMSLQQMDMNTVMYPEITGGDIQENQQGHDMQRMKMPARPPGGDTAKDKMNNMQHMHMNEQKKDSMPGMKMNNMTQKTPSPLVEKEQGDEVTLNYAMLRSPVKTTLPDAPTKEMHFTLTGNMNRYVWTIDNRTVTEWDKILIKAGENVRMVITNNSMMRHPMHLHGHDFRVLNGQGEYAPLKNVLDIMPMETDTIDFAANKSGDWFFHCHILYHMMAGMGNVFSYANSPANPELPDAVSAYRMFKKDNSMIHFMTKAGLESNGTEGEAMLSSNRYSLQGIWHLGYVSHHGYESEINFGRYLGKMQWWFPYVGFDYHYKKTHEIEKTVLGQVSNKNDRKTFVAGVQYTMPMLILADARVDGDGKFRFQLSREDIPITNRLRFNFMANTDKEYMAGLRYVVSKWFSLSTHYDSDMGYGAGITLNY